MTARRRGALLVLPAAVLVACGGGGPTSTPTATASATPTAPAPSAVVVRLQPEHGGGWIAVGTSWDIDLVRSDGHRMATAHAAHTTGSDYLDALPLSASDTAVYFLDGATTVRRLSAEGATSVATTVPADGGRQRVLFAVSPDDARIAVAVMRSDEAGDVHETLSVRRLQGGDERVLTDFTTHPSGQPEGGLDHLLLRPLGWHGSTLVVATQAPVQNSPDAEPPPVSLLALYNADSGATLPNPCEREAHPQAVGIFCDNTLHGWDGAHLASPAAVNEWVSGDGAEVAGVDQGLHLGVGPLNAGTLAPVQVDGLPVGWLDSTHLLLQDLPAGQTPTSHVLVVSGTTAQPGARLDGAVVETVPPQLR